MIQPQQPAFPTPEGALKALTKREYFAALNYGVLMTKVMWDAKAEEIMIQNGLDPARDTEMVVAKMAVNGADALIAALNKPV